MSTPVTRVDLEQLQQAVRQIDYIKQYIERSCLGYMPAITQALGSASNVDMSDAEYQFTREATVFGAFYSAYGMQARNDGVYRAVQGSLQELLRHLDTTAQNLQTAIENFQSTEDANVQGAQDMERVATGNSPPANSPGGGATYV